MAVVVAVIQQKGGVGKTTIAGNLAGEFVAKHRVVLFDLDPQKSLTAWAGWGDGLLKSRVRPFEVDERRPQTLWTAVEEAGRDVDVLIIDCAPGLSAGGLQAAAIADLALLPVGPSPLDVLAVREALDVMDVARRRRGGKRPRVALVPSKVSQSTTLGRELPANLKALGALVLPGVSQRVAVAEAVMVGLTVRESVPMSEAAAEFRALARAVERLW